jgi:hypothetical protein
VFRSEWWAERCVIFICVFCYYLFPPKLSHTCNPCLAHILYSAVIACSFLSFSFFFYHCFYPAHQITVCNVYTLFDTIQTRTRSLLLFNKCIFSISIPSMSKRLDTERNVWYRPGSDAAAQPNHAADSLCSNCHCRWGSHARHTSTLVSIPSSSVVYLTS